MKKLSMMAVVAALAFVFPANASFFDVFSHETGTIQPTGPRQPTGGDRYFNIEGANNGTYASSGALRLDLSGIKADFDAEFGAGNWTIDGMWLELTQDNSGFTADGGVEVIYASDDVTDIKTPGSPLVYSDMGTPLGLAAAPFLSYTFIETATGDIDSYDITGAADIAAEVYAGDMLTLVFRETDPGVAATYRGQESYQNRMPPRLLVSAVPEPASLLLVGLGVLMLRRR